MHVLIVDDDLAFVDTVRETVLDVLHGTPFVTIAHTGDAAMIAVRDSAQIDVGILDIHIPGPSGIKVAQSIRQQNRYALIIILTGSTNGDEDDIAKRAGADLVLGKNEFVDDLAQALVRHQQ